MPPKIASAQATSAVSYAWLDKGEPAEAVEFQFKEPVGVVERFRDLSRNYGGDYGEHLPASVA